MDDFMDTEPHKRIIDLTTFQQRFKTNSHKKFEFFYDVSKRLEKTENVNQIFRDEKYELTSADEIFQQKILVKEDQLKKRFFTPFTISRSPNFFDPEQFGGTRDELEFFKFNFKPKF